MKTIHFESLGLVHVGILVMTFLIPVVFGVFVKRSKEHGQFLEKGIRYILGTILIGNALVQFMLNQEAGNSSLVTSLPMQLCDWAMIAVIIALFTRNQLSFEVAFFWGLAGTLQALITPNLKGAYPIYTVVCFFLMHSGIVSSILYLLMGPRLKPERGCVWRVMLLSQIYLITALTTNELTGANYGFLAHKPLGRSLLDLLPGWKPAYIASLDALALGMMLMLYAPFRLMGAVDLNLKELS